MSEIIDLVKSEHVNIWQETEKKDQAIFVHVVPYHLCVSMPPKAYKIFVKALNAADKKLTTPKKKRRVKK